MRVRGVALVLVLWLVAVLAALAAGLALAARVEALQVRTLDRGGLARQHARAGIEYAVAQLLARPGWAGDGRPLEWRFAGSRVRLQVQDQAGLVDLNQAPPGLLAELFRGQGLDAVAAEALATRIVQRRSQRRGRFLAVAELRALPGMDAALYARLRGLLGVHGGALPAAEVAPVAVRMALRGWSEAGGQAPAAGAVPGSVYSIDSISMSAAGGRAHVRGVVRLDSAADVGRAYSILGWEEEDSLR